MHSFLLLFSYLAWLSRLVQCSPVAEASGPGLGVRDGPSTKVVAAHFMVGNSYPYTYDNWLSDINLARSHGIDAFALNMGRDDWQPNRIDDVYAAALTTLKDGTTPFRLFLSFDMSSLPCANSNDAAALAALVRRYATHPAQLLQDGRVVLSTFAGDQCAFGGAGWESVVDGQNVWFIPAFFGDVPTWGQWGVVNGVFNWNAGWPAGNFNVSWNYDAQWKSQMPVGKSYIAPVSPWFFTHYGPDTYDKNWIYRSDDWLLAVRWELLIAHRDEIDMVEIISWNDYGESHYVGPIEGAQPMSEAWTNGFEHQAWLEMMSYYIEAFKTGIYPRIVQDKVFLWARLFPAGAIASADSVPRPYNWEWTEDYAWAVVFLTSPADVTLACGNSAATFTVEGGASKLKLPLFESCTVRAMILRQGQLVANFEPENMFFNSGGQPETYNFNALVTVSG